MNFMKNSLFQRNLEQEREEEMPEEGGVLAVWGSPSSGKTVVSVKLAEHLAKKKRNVILILADMITPPLPYLCAPSDIEQERSLGSILAASHVTENLIKKNCMFYRKNDYLSMVGMLKGENVFTYPPYEKEQAAELLQLAAQIAPYVIVDCTSNIASDILSAVALMEADTVLLKIHQLLILPASTAIRPQMGCRQAVEGRVQYQTAGGKQPHGTDPWQCVVPDSAQQ